MPLIILDRDGVINYDSDDYIKSPDEWIPVPGSLEAIARLNRAGYHVAVASNQSGVARGFFDLTTLEKIHQKMRAELAHVGGAIDTILFCPHGPNDGCGCRKPKPGMLLEIAKKFQCELTGVLAIGDSLRDIEAALSVGATPVLVRTGKGLRTLQEQRIPDDVAVYDDLAAAVDALLQQKV